MGKKTDIKKPVAPLKRAAKSQPAVEKIAPPEPPAAPEPTAPKAKKAVVPAPAKKPVAKKATKPAKPAKAAKSTKAKPAYTHDDVALRAYFIAERRQKAGLWGDTHSDWVAAERELAAEAKAGKKAKAKV